MPTPPFRIPIVQLELMSEYEVTIWLAFINCGYYDGNCRRHGSDRSFDSVVSNSHMPSLALTVDPNLKHSKGCNKEQNSFYYTYCWQLIFTYRIHWAASSFSNHRPQAVRIEILIPNDKDNITPSYPVGMLGYSQHHRLRLLPRLLFYPPPFLKHRPVRLGIASTTPNDKTYSTQPSWGIETTHFHSVNIRVCYLGFFFSPFHFQTIVLCSLGY